MYLNNPKQSLKRTSKKNNGCCTVAEAGGIGSPA